MWFACRPVFAASALACALVLCSACKKSDQPLQGSGVGSQQIRDVATFSRLQVSGAFEVEINVGTKAPLEVRGDDNLLAHVTSRIEGDALVITLDRPVKKKQPIRINLSTETLSSLNLGIAAKARLQGVKAERFEVRAAGGSELVAKGSSSSLDVQAKSAARLDFVEFSSAEANVSATDAARIKLGHVERLKVTLTGLSQIRYRGDPTLEQHVTRPARLIREQ